MLIASTWRNRHLHKQVWTLAFPMILSNLSIPLVALVDTMVIGRLPNAHNMAAVAVGSGFYMLLVGCLNFLRMTTTGFTAQAFGLRQEGQLKQILLQGILFTLILACLMGVLAIPLYHVALHYMEPSTQLKALSQQFLHWRLLGLPATLINYTLVGWFLGTQNARIPFMILIVTNTANMLLSICFVLILKFGVTGAAQAAIIAEWLGCLWGCYLALKTIKRYSGNWSLYLLKKWQTWKPLLFVNRDIFIRSVTLQAVFFLITFQGTRLGETTVAANVIILNGLLITSYILDGFAHAIEALCGKAIGGKNKRELAEVLIIAGGWALILSLAFAVIFLLTGHLFINLQTTLTLVQEQAYPLIPFLALLPLIAVWSYLFDGLFIGATRAKEMRNSMLLAFIISLPLGLSLQFLGNNGLWITFLTFMGLRSLLLGFSAWQIKLKNHWV